MVLSLNIKDFVTFYSTLNYFEIKVFLPYKTYQTDTIAIFVRKISGIISKQANMKNIYCLRCPIT